MARKATEAAILNVPEGIPAGHAVTLAEEQAVRTVEAASMNAVELGKLIGRIEAAHFSATVSERIIAEAFNQIRNGKQYKGLPYTAADGKTETVSDLEQFCEVFLGKSVRRCRQLADNLALLGPELYEQAEKIGLRARDYQALKALPQEEQAIVKQALTSESREQVLDLLQDMAAKHAKEKESAQAKLDAAQKQLADAQATLEAKDQLLTTRNKKLDELTVELKKRDTRSPEEAEAQRQRVERELLEQLQNTSTKLMFEIQGFAQSVADCLERAEPESSMQSAVVSTVQFLFQRIDEIAKANQIPVDFAEVVVPSWMRAAMAPLETAEN